MLVFTALTDEECASKLNHLLHLAVIKNLVKDFVKNLVEFGAFQLAQVNVAAFPPHQCKFHGLAIVDNLT